MGGENSGCAGAHLFRVEQASRQGRIGVAQTKRAAVKRPFVVS